MAIFGRFWLFLALFWQFFNAKIAQSQNKGNSYYKNLENNIPLDFVIGIFPILTSWDAISKKLPKNRPKMAKISQKCTFWVKKYFFVQKLNHTNRTFVNPLLKFFLGDFQASGIIFQKALAFSVFFTFLKNRHFWRKSACTRAMENISAKNLRFS